MRIKRYSIYAVLSLVVTGTATSVFINASPTTSMTTPRAKLTLEDLFAGRAKFQEVSEAQKITARFWDNNVTTYDGKWNVIQIPIETLPSKVRYIALIRGIYKNPFFAGQNGENTFSEKWNVFLMQSWDGVNFEQNGHAVFDRLKRDWSIYDPHIAVDTSVSPPRYIMTTECIKWGGSHSTCVSETRTPWVQESWSEPRIVVSGQSEPRHVSASTGVTLADGGRFYIKWTQVDDGFRSPMHATNPAPDEGNESTSSWAAPLPNLSSFVGEAGHVGVSILPAVPNVYCDPKVHGWDCNNRDIQDWKKVGSQYYAVYNGGNYYRCIRPSQDRNAGHKSLWGLAIRRSSHPLGTYGEFARQVLFAERDDTCGISYPYITELDGETYMYFSMFPKAGGNESRRVKLVPTAEGGPAGVAPIAAYPRDHYLNFTVGSEVVRDRVQSLYQKVLGRNPNWWEVEAWVEEATKHQDFDAALARGILSPEVPGSIAALNPWQQVALLYQTILMRDHDPAGQAHHVGLLQSGVTINQLIEGFLASPEYRARASYRQVLRREPDTEGFRNVVAHLAAGGDLGPIRRRLALSVEGRRTMDAIFGEVLSRRPTESEVQWAADVMASGASYLWLRSHILRANAEIWNPLTTFWPAAGPGLVFGSLTADQFVQRRAANVSMAILHQDLQSISSRRITRGHIDRLTRADDNSVTVSGWGCLQHHEGPVPFRLMANDRTLFKGIADQTNEEGVNVACATSRGSAHRFQAPIPFRRTRGLASVPVRLEVQSPMTGAWTVMNSQPMPEQSSRAYGRLWSRTRLPDNSIRTGGWACVPGLARAARVRLLAGDKQVRSTVTFLPPEVTLDTRCMVPGAFPIRFEIHSPARYAQKISPRDLRLEVHHPIAQQWVTPLP